MRAYLTFAACLLVFFIASLTHPVAAATSSDVNFTTSPVTLAINIKPGSSVTQKLQIMNNTGKPASITMQVKTFGAYGSSGEAAISDFLPGDLAPSWIKLSPSKFVAQPGVWTDVHATLSLPVAAQLGYYYAIVFQPDIPTLPHALGTSTVKGSNAILMLVDTGSAGEQRQLGVANFSVSQKLYEYLPTSFTVTVHNPGNIFLAPIGNIFISKNSSGVHTLDTLDVNAGGGNVLPNSNRVFNAQWSNGFPVFIPQTKNGQPVTKNGKPVERLKWDVTKADRFRFGRYYAKLVLAYNNGTRDVVLNSTLSFWVIPWKLVLGGLVVLVVVLFGCWLIVRGIVRKLNSIRKKRGSANKDQA